VTDKMRSFAPRTTLTPKRKQVFMIDFSPTRGGETPDSHPALILTDAAFNATGLAIVCSGSHSLLSSVFAVEVPVSLGLGFDGFFHPTHVRTVAFRVRNPRLLGIMPDELFNEVIMVVRDLIDP
jgi:mRNA-degrading endonuclease toxin of MazEF toxin-antitoxin module